MTKVPTEILAEMKEREQRATPGPWSAPFRPQPGDCVGYIEHRPELMIVVDHRENFTFPEADMDFIAHARTDLPRLIEAVEWLRLKYLESLNRFADDDIARSERQKTDHSLTRILTGEKE